MNNEFETLGIDNNQDLNNNPNNLNPVTNPNENLEQTAENIIKEVNQEINAAPAPETPAVSPAVSEPAQPVAPAPVVPETPAATPEAPAQPVSEPSVDAAAPVQEDLSNISYDTKDNYNEFANEKPKKKTSIKSIILLVVLLIGLGGAVYYSVFLKDIFNLGLGSGGKSEPLSAKEVTIELGSEIPTDITVYMSRSLNATEYKLITNKIDNNKVGEYKFDVVYNGNTYTGTAKVTDTTAPVLTTKDVTTKSATDVVAGDFVDNCTDLSGCTIEFGGSFDASTFTDNGTYSVTITAKDEYENKTEVSANLIIDADAVITSKLSCTKTGRSSDYAASLAYLYEFALDEDGNVTGVTDKRTYTFDTVDELTKHKGDNTTNAGEYDDTALTYKSSKAYTAAEMATSNSFKSLPKTKTELQTYLSGKGFTCN